MREPILRNMQTATRKVVAYGGLHMIRGNSKPYFSLTMGSWRISRGRLSEDCFGAAHDELLKLWPDLAPLAALHLSTIDGVPMHAAENGWYWLAGTMGGAGEQYYGGSGSDARSPDQCLQILADHLRINLDGARALRDQCSAHIAATVSAYDRVWVPGSQRKAGKQFMTDYCEQQRLRWKAEADKARTDLGLVIFGDTYEAA